VGTVPLWLISCQKDGRCISLRIFGIIRGKKKYILNLTMNQDDIIRFARQKGNGFAFSASDLPDYSSRTMADKTLCVMARAGKIRRVMRGIYDLPRWSDILKKESPPDLDAVANALARKFGWILLPCDEGALNGFGLSTQIPARKIYLSSGPSRVYKVGKHAIEFQHRCSRETDILGRNARMVVRALKGLGKDYATNEIVASMASRYSDEEWRQICEASKRVSSWIRDLVNAEKERRKA